MFDSDTSLLLGAWQTFRPDDHNRQRLTTDNAAAHMADMGIGHPIHSEQGTLKRPLRLRRRPVGIGGGIGRRHGTGRRPTARYHTFAIPPSNDGFVYRTLRFPAMTIARPGSEHTQRQIHNITPTSPGNGPPDSPPQPPEQADAPSC